VRKSRKDLRITVQLIVPQTARTYGRRRMSEVLRTSSRSRMKLRDSGPGPERALKAGSTGDGNPRNWRRTISLRISSLAPDQTRLKKAVRPLQAGTLARTRLCACVNKACARTPASGRQWLISITEGTKVPRRVEASVAIDPNLSQRMHASAISSEL